MRARTVFLVVGLVAAGLAACGAADPAQTPIAFGVGGGNMIPYTVTIQPNGSVRVRGPVRTAHRQIPPATVRRLRSRIRQASLTSRQCHGTLPDVGSEFIRLGSRTVTVHGTCEPRFTRVWKSLAQAVGLSF